MVYYTIHVLYESMTDVTVWCLNIILMPLYDLHEQNEINEDIGYFCKYIYIKGLSADEILTYLDTAPKQS